MKKREIPSVVHSSNVQTREVPVRKFEMPDVNWKAVALIVWTIVAVIGTIVAMFVIPNHSTEGFLSNYTKMLVDSADDLYIKTSEDPASVYISSSEAFTIEINDVESVSSSVDEAWTGNSAGQMITYTVAGSSEVKIKASVDNAIVEVISRTQVDVKIKVYFLVLLLLIPALGVLLWLLGLLFWESFNS